MNVAATFDCTYRRCKISRSCSEPSHCTF